MRALEFVDPGRERSGTGRPMLAAAVILGCLLLQLLSPAIAMDSEHYALNWDVLGAGGGPISSDSYALNATVGQPSIGFKASDTYDLCSGFWCGAGYAVYLPIVFHNY